MTEPTHWLPLTGENVRAAHALIKPYIHETPVLTCKTLNRIASTPQTPEWLIGTPFEGQTPASPKINFFFKCENYQRIGAFKVRGAFHAVLRVVGTMGEEEVRRKGVITHSSGNHAQALALAASTVSIPAYIIMPSISIPSKIAATQSYGAKVVFSGSTSEEREAVVAEVQKETGAILVPPYDHPDTILGQGTVGVELEKQVKEMLAKEAGLSVHGEGNTGALDAVILPTGGAGLTSGVATFFSEKSTRVFGSEPSFQDADDCRRGLVSGNRIPSVKTLTIADGLRTPVGEIPWKIVSDPKKVAGVYAVSEPQIRDAMKLVLERMKVVIEPSAAVPLAVALFNEEFRGLVEKESGGKGWDVGIVFSGGNTTIESIMKLFGEENK